MEGCVGLCGSVHLCEPGELVVRRGYTFQTNKLAGALAVDRLPNIEPSTSRVGTVKYSEDEWHDTMWTCGRRATRVRA